ncbi:MAG: hypothetical protein AB9858_04945 [Acidaminococcaceae bacterium]
MPPKLKEKIEVFITLHNAIEELWFKQLDNQNTKKQNFNRIKIKHIDLEILRYIYAYCSMLSKISPGFINILMDKGIERTRVKESLSIDDKIRRYKNDPRKDCGSVIIHKSLNDLYGARVLINDDFDFDDVVNCINADFVEQVVAQNASNEKGYQAVHVYVKCKCGHFRWELQIWRKQDEHKNMKLHEEYKREYIHDLAAIRR